jgi:hypothetical protein
MMRWRFVALIMAIVLAAAGGAQGYDYGANMEETAYLSTSYGEPISPLGTTPTALIILP